MSSDKLNVTVGNLRGVGGKKRNKGCALYFGLHFCNDATRYQRGKIITPKKVLPDSQRFLQRHEVVLDPKNNITVDECFWVYTLREIKKGEELFLSYNDDPNVEEVTDVVYNPRGI